MTDLKTLLDLIQTVGENPLLVVILTAVLIKKYLINGSGSFFRTSITTWLTSQQERIKTDVEVLNALKELEEKYQGIQEGLWAQRRSDDDRLKRVETVLTEHSQETRALLTLMKRKTEPIDGGSYGH